MKSEILCSLTDDDLKPTDREKRLLQDLFDWQERSRKMFWILGKPVGYNPESENKMNENDIIKLLKKNERAFTFLSDEVQNYLRKHIKNVMVLVGSPIYPHVIRGWEKVNQTIYSTEIFRLPEDYEPVFMDIKIEVQDDVNGFAIRRIRFPYGGDYVHLKDSYISYTDAIFMAPSGYEFYGFVYSNGDILLEPIYKVDIVAEWPRTVRYKKIQNNREC